MAPLFSYGAPLTLSLVLVWTSVFAGAASLRAKADPRLAARIVDGAACSKIFESEEIVLNATDAYNCLLSVPFKADVATQFLNYFRDSLQFQSTLQYLKSPPSSYQQPSVDVMAGLDLIQREINTGVFDNEYAFEAAVQNLIYSTHDGHLSLYAGALSVFSFYSPLGIVSVSSDGMELPKVYSIDDLYAVRQDNSHWAPSPIKTINGKNTTDFLTEYAALNSPGGLEPHADWNLLMSSWAAGVQGIYSVFQGDSPFYPGDKITFTFENGSVFGPTNWLAAFNVPYDIPLIETGEDFYDFFVAYDAAVNASSLDPAATDVASTVIDTPAAAISDPSGTIDAATADTASATAVPQPTSWNDVFRSGTSYPDKADIVQPNLEGYPGGYVTGYYLRDQSLAVLSIPSFYATGDDVLQFTNTVAAFIEGSKKAGLKRVVIDLQHNLGGAPLLAIDTFKQFFPSIDPYGASRLRAHAPADVLGNTYTRFFTSSSIGPTDYHNLASDVWVVTDRLNAATGRNFTSWPEFYGPHADSRDYFSTPQRYDLSSITFADSDTLSTGFAVYGYANRTATRPQPFASQDIVLLTDGICASTCTLFVEMMHHQGGVRTVVVGGRPERGPMQALGGSRGARSYDLAELDADIAQAKLINSSTTATLPQRNISMVITAAQINLRDQIRKGEDFPLQFAYEPADCRIFYTLNTFKNYTNLWVYTANATWNHTELCVKGSTGLKSSNATQITGKLGVVGSSVTDPLGPATAEKSTLVATGGYANSKDTAAASTTIGEMVDPDTLAKHPDEDRQVIIQTTGLLNFPCGPSSRNNQPCGANERCIPREVCVNGRFSKQFACRRECPNGIDDCGGKGQQRYDCKREVLCDQTQLCRTLQFCEFKKGRALDAKCIGLVSKPKPTVVPIDGPPLDPNVPYVVNGDGAGATVTTDPGVNGQAQATPVPQHKAIANAIIQPFGGPR